MSNLIKAEWYRFWKTQKYVLHITLAIVTLWAVGTGVISLYGDMTNFDYIDHGRMTNTYMLFVIPFWYICNDFDYRTIIISLSGSYSRRDIFFSKLLVYISGTIALGVIVPLTASAIHILINKYIWVALNNDIVLILSIIFKLMISYITMSIFIMTYCVFVKTTSNFITYGIGIFLTTIVLYTLGQMFLGDTFVAFVNMILKYTPALYLTDHIEGTSVLNMLTSSVIWSTIFIWISYLRFTTMDFE